VSLNLVFLLQLIRGFLKRDVILSLSKDVEDYRFDCQYFDRLNMTIKTTFEIISNKPIYFAPISAQRICMAFCRTGNTPAVFLCPSAMEATSKETDG